MFQREPFEELSKKHTIKGSSSLSFIWFKGRQTPEVSFALRYWTPCLRMFGSFKGTPETSGQIKDTWGGIQNTDLDCGTCGSDLLSSSILSTIEFWGSNICTSVPTLTWVGHENLNCSEHPHLPTVLVRERTSHCISSTLLEDKTVPMGKLLWSSSSSAPSAVALHVQDVENAVVRQIYRIIESWGCRYYETPPLAATPWTSLNLNSWTSNSM